MNETKEALKTLKELYEFVEKAKTSRELFSHIENFINFIEKTDAFKLPIKKIEKEIKEKLQEIKTREAKTAEKLKNLIKQTKTIEFIRNKITEKEKQIEQTTDQDIVKKLNKDINEYRDIEKRLKGFIKAESKEIDFQWIEQILNTVFWLNINTPRYEKFVSFQEDLVALKDLIEKIKEEKKSKPWGCWGHLKISQLINEFINYDGFLQFFLSNNERIEDTLKRKKIIHPIFDLFIEDSCKMMIELKKIKKFEDKVKNQTVYMSIQSEVIQVYKFYCRGVYGYLLTFKENDYQKLINLKNTKINPYCYEEGNIGYLKFTLHGKKYNIGKKDSRAFRLLKFLLDSGLDNRRNIEEAYKAIELPKDKSIFDSILSHGSKRIKIEQLRIIKNTIKELQKGNKLKEGKTKLKIRLDSDNNLIWIELLK